jgi:hypothetical protein
MASRSANPSVAAEAESTLPVSVVAAFLALFDSPEAELWLGDGTCQML